MVMLDKTKASVFIKIGAVLLAITFVIGFMPLFTRGEVGDFFKSLFTSQAKPTQTQEIAKLKAIVKKDPKNQQALVDLGNAYYDSAKPKEAVEYYTKALELDPKNVDVRVDMGAAYFELKNYDKALEAFRVATDAKPDHATAWYNMGVVFKAKGDNPNLKFAWNRYLTLEPTGERADQVRQELSKLGQ